MNEKILCPRYLQVLADLRCIQRTPNDAEVSVQNTVRCCAKYVLVYMKKPSMLFLIAFPLHQWNICPSESDSHQLSEQKSKQVGSSCWQCGVSIHRAFLARRLCGAQLLTMTIKCLNGEGGGFGIHPAFVTEPKFIFEPFAICTVHTSTSMYRYRYRYSPFKILHVSAGLHQA